MNNSKRLLAIAVSAALAAPMAAYATNGMNLDGYGPIAAGMGGASMAYDNGTAAMMNNPATLSMMDDGSRLDLAIGNLRPNVSASHAGAGMSWDSGATSFLMPAIGWAKTDGDLTYGAGMFAQGGMGADYGSISPGSAFVWDTSAMGGSLPMAMDAGNAEVASWEEMSEVGVMRILFPLSKKVNDKLTVGGSIDYVRANMDLKMVMTGGMINDMMTTQNIGTMAVTAGLGGMLPATIYGAQFDFADTNPYSGEAQGAGFAAKLGFTYQVNPQLSVGGTYHNKTALSDLEGTSKMNMVYDNAGTADVMTMSGDIAVKDFQWPATMALGLAFQMNDKTMIVADVKRINWSDVMKDFKVSFSPMAGESMDVTMYQNWEDQTAYQLGVSHAMNEALTLRAGVNMANNPVPDSTLHYLFPATVTNHYTFGAGYTMSADSSVDFSASYAPEVEDTNGMGMDITHSQITIQAMYSKKF